MKDYEKSEVNKMSDSQTVCRQKVNIWDQIKDHSLTENNTNYFMGKCKYIYSRCK